MGLRSTVDEAICLWEDLLSLQGEQSGIGSLAALLIICRFMCGVARRDVEAPYRNFVPFLHGTNLAIRDYVPDYLTAKLLCVKITPLSGAAASGRRLWPSPELCGPRGKVRLTCVH